MNLTGYLRYSPGGEGSSLDIQRDAITRWADAEGHVIVKWKDDAGISGAEDLSVRTGLFDAIETLKSGSDGIVVRELSRFSRDVIMQETLFRDIRTSGGLVFSTKSTENMCLNDDDSDPARTMIRVIMGAVSAYERKVITMRMAAGRRMAAEKGRFAYGAVPFGSTRVDHPSGKGSALVPDESAQAVITRMRELRDSGLTIAQVTDALNDEGFTAPRGGRWVTSSVYRALQRAEAAAA